MKLFYTTDEVAKHFGVAPSKVRFYVKEFRIKVQKSANKSRYTSANIDTLTDIMQLVEKENYTIPGAKQQLLARKKGLSNKEQVIQRLEGVKDILKKLHGGYE